MGKETNVAIITEEAYDNAVRATMDEFMEMPGKDGKPGGMGALLASMSGAAFASRVKDKLFVKENEQ